MRSGSFVSTKLIAARFPDGMLIFARSVSRSTSDTKVDFDQSITLEEEMRGFLACADKLPARPANIISEDIIVFLTAHFLLKMVLQLSLSAVKIEN